MNAVSFLIVIIFAYVFYLSEYFSLFNGYITNWKNRILLLRFRRLSIYLPVGDRWAGLIKTRDGR